MTRSSVGDAVVTSVTEARTLLSLINRYSIALTEAAGTVPGVVDPGNREILGLVELFRNEPISSNDLSERSGLSRRDTNRLAKTLDAYGLIDRVPSDADRRVLLLELTTSGRRQRTKFVRSLSGFFDESAELAASIAEAFDQERPTVAPPDTTDVLDATEAVARAGVVITDAFEVGADGPTRRAAFALILVATGEFERPSELAERLGYTSGGMAHVLDDLERAGYIERRYGTLADDRRASVVTLTEAGCDWVTATCSAVVAAGPVVAPVFASLAARR